MPHNKLYGQRPASVRHCRAHSLVLFGCLLLACPSLYAEDLILADLADLSLEELANIQITSVSRRPESLSGAAASIYVITAEDIRRSGVRRLPEALRFAPNLQVARTAANGYAITARGFNNSNGLSNKLLVLIDGRTVYSPVLSGVLWDMQDVLLEDIERIEVISGPGATLWGANAVNGVINIITRTAAETQGALVSGGAGNQELQTALRYGDELGANGHYRVYGKRFEIDNTRRDDGSANPDGWEHAQAGFRADWRQGGNDFTVQGDAYRGYAEEFGDPYGKLRVYGTNLMARLSRQLENGSNVRLQSYYDQTERQDRLLLPSKADIFDIEFQHSIPLERQTLVWGAGYRRSHDDIPATEPPFVFFFQPSSETLTWRNVFVQDEIQLRDDLALTLGLKLEENDYTGWENLPSARLAWQFAHDQLLWAAASRAVRAPARLDRDFFFSFTIPSVIDIPFIVGGPDFKSEIAKVYEIGYRAQPHANLSLSATVFQARYDRLRSGEDPDIVGAAEVQNEIAGIVNGIEGWGSLQLQENWRLSAGFVTLHKHLRLDPDSTDPEGPRSLGNDPEWQWQLRSAHDIGESHQLDVMLRYVSALPDPEVPSYLAVDARWGWQLQRNTELSLTLENIFDNAHPEWSGNEDESLTEFERAAFLELVWRSP